LSSTINSSATSFSISGTTTGWPATAGGGFYMVIDPGLSTEEKVFVGSRSSGSLSSVTRGVDGTLAASHDAGATCYPVFTAVDADQANDLASTMTTKGDLISTDGTDPARLGVGTNNHRLVAASGETTGLKWVADTQNTVIDAKGDLLVGSAADTVARLAVDTTDGAVLIADSTATNGVSWQAQNTGVRNILYNGAMQVAQRSNSIASITAVGYYTADRWKSDFSSLGTWTQSVENDAPTGSGFRKSLKMLCTTADASPAAGDYHQLYQVLEGQDLQAFRKGTSSAQQFTISFWVKANVTGTYIFELFDADNTRQVSKSYTISASGTWEFKTLTLPADTTGAFDNDTAASLYCVFWLGAGSSSTSGTLNTSWATLTQANRAVGQTNLAAATNNYWQLTGVQLNVGGVAAPFEFKSYGQELRECQRYFYRHADGAVTSNGPVGMATAFSATDARSIVQFPVTMRTTPTLAASYTSGTDYYAFARNSADDTFNSFTLLNGFASQVLIGNSSEISSTAGHAGYFRVNNALGKVDFAAEL
jgi:hypothetical protein